MTTSSQDKLREGANDGRLDEARNAAEAAGLVYVSPDDAGLTRRQAGRGFAYRWPDGRRVAEADALKRIRALAIPPAWREVWISADPAGHLQAMGVDQRGRRQYRYHAQFRALRESAKFEHLTAFAAVLPALRSRAARDMTVRGLPREKVLATVVHLLETTMIRVGNASYAKENHSYGLTTLLSRHVDVHGSELRFHFTGKSGKSWRLGVRDRRVARIVRSCQELPGQHLFQYFDEDGERRSITSADVNAYLKEATGADITAKDFRTWAGTVLAGMALAEFAAADQKAGSKHDVSRAIERVAAILGNTPTICRKCYVHPAIISAYLDEGLVVEVEQPIDGEPGEETAGLRPEEAALLAFLRTRLECDPTPAPLDRRRAGFRTRVRSGRTRRNEPTDEPLPLGRTVAG